MQIAAERPTAGQSTVIRKTDAGGVRGRCEDGICRFLGVPYAAPPVGVNRFKVPQPVEPWQGERDATEPGHCAPHRIKDFPAIDVVPLVGYGADDGEDYNEDRPHEQTTEDDIDFHLAIAEARGNALFSQIVASFVPLMRVAVPQVWKTRHTDEEKSDILARHRNLAWAIANRDAEEADRCIAVHFDEAIGALLR